MSSVQTKGMPTNDKVAGINERHSKRGINSIGEFFLKYIDSSNFICSEKSDIPLRKIMARRQGFNPDDPSSPDYVDVLTDERFIGYRIQDFLKESVIAPMTKTILYPSLGGIDVPIYGAHSDLIRSCEFFVYDNPKIEALSGCRTAFIDNSGHAFFHADFLNKLLEEAHEDKLNSANPLSSLRFLVMHELTHFLYYHFLRMQNIEPDLANIAQDLHINGSLMLDYGPDADNVPEIAHLDPSGVLVKTGVGFKEGDKENYGRKNEEMIAKEIMENPDHPYHPDNMSKQGGSDENENGPSQDGPITLSKEDIQDIIDRLKNGEKPDAQSGGGATIHFDDSVTEEDKQALADAMREADIDAELNDGSMDINGGDEANADHGTLQTSEVRDIIDKSVPNADEFANKAIGINKSDEELDVMEQDHKANVKEKIEKSVQEARKHGEKYPGSHMMSYASEYIDEINKAKIDWSQKLRNIMRHVTDTVTSQGEYTPDAQIDPMMAYDGLFDVMGYDPVLMLPEQYTKSGRIACVVDTSGSMTPEDLSQAFGEALGFVVEGFEGECQYSPEVVIYCADTALRGEPITITKENYEQVLRSSKSGRKAFDVHGGGGTSFEGPLQAVIKREKDRGEQVDMIVLLTDWGFSPLSKEFLKKLDTPVAIAGLECADAEPFRHLDGGNVSIIQIPRNDTAPSVRPSM